MTVFVDFAVSMIETFSHVYRCIGFESTSFLLQFFKFCCGTASTSQKLYHFRNVCKLNNLEMVKNPEVTRKYATVIDVVAGEKTFLA